MNPDKDYVISTPVHTDGSILTLLCTFDNYGLQDRAARKTKSTYGSVGLDRPRKPYKVVNKAGEWSWVVPVRNSLIGKLLPVNIRFETFY